ncbi:MAG: hypothetical protein IPG88_18555 [Gemmatimonadetes bacterium]|nr:hypothetical protein [Gemmatimonadota bacterium]
MCRPLTALAVALLLAAPSIAQAQTGEALIKKLGASAPVPNPTFPADKASDVQDRVERDGGAGEARSVGRWLSASGQLPVHDRHRGCHVHKCTWR